MVDKEIPLKKCKPITYCKFCKALGQKVRCTVMTKHQPPFAMRDWYKHYACDEHKGLIQDPDPRGLCDLPVKESKKYRDDGHLTEADYQTWMRL